MGNHPQGESSFHSTQRCLTASTTTWWNICSKGLMLTLRWERHHRHRAMKMASGENASRWQDGSFMVQRCFTARKVFVHRFWVKWLYPVLSCGVLAAASTDHRRSVTLQRKHHTEIPDKQWQPSSNDCVFLTGVNVLQNIHSNHRRIIIIIVHVLLRQSHVPSLNMGYSSTWKRAVMTSPSVTSACFSAAPQLNTVVTF